MYNEPAKSALAFCQSMTKKYHELLKTGDITDAVERRPSRQKICVDPEAEANWLTLVIKRIEKEGMSWNNAAKGTPWEGRPEALRHLAVRRGIYSTKMFKAKKAESAQRINDEARRVNKLARGSHQSLEKVLKDSTIDVNQYYAAKGRLNLPHIKNRKK
jgi:hypothetical protein